MGRETSAITTQTSLIGHKHHPLAAEVNRIGKIAVAADAHLHLATLFSSSHAR
jgi:hypothetical protein